MSTNLKRAQGTPEAAPGAQVPAQTRLEVQVQALSDEEAVVVRQEGGRFLAKIHGDREGGRDVNARFATEVEARAAGLSEVRGQAECPVCHLVKLLYVDNQTSKVMCAEDWDIEIARILGGR
jgi:hypothetical protein